VFSFGVFFWCFLLVFSFGVFFWCSPKANGIYFCFALPQQKVFFIGVGILLGA